MQIGIIAGTGELPVIVAKDARERGYRVITVALENLAPREMDGISDEIRWVNPGRLGEIISTLKKHRVKEAIMAGKVPKSLLYKSKITPDLRAVKLLFSIKDRTDDAILSALTKELECEGIQIIDTVKFSPHLLTPEGCLTARQPDEEQWKDVEFGWGIAKEIGKLDIGQTVVVKGRAVMAVEAIEGTDEAILRGGHWADEGAVVVKVSKPQQDMRLDVPAVGMDTVKSMEKVRARVLALEAGRSMIMGRDAVLREAERAGIVVVGISAETLHCRRSKGH
ncbi:MAG TPA: UDP-2,3-diacylglucosamine diphosphatase LpxI [Dissulfurispiraceae bacterium]|nr:UDP-2,3-diacylglucosamine diphosphatase LpxI [Dissulfurispiraceae bacterium]